MGILENNSAPFPLNLKHQLILKRSLPLYWYVSIKRKRVKIDRTVFVFSESSIKSPGGLFFRVSDSREEGFNIAIELPGSPGGSGGSRKSNALKKYFQACVFHLLVTSLSF